MGKQDGFSKTTNTKKKNFTSSQVLFHFNESFIKGKKYGCRVYGRDWKNNGRLLLSVLAHA